MIRIALMGDGAVGKTSLRKKYMGLGFSVTHIMTVGADFAVHQKEIEGNQVLFQIWDLAGQEKWFSEILPRFYKGSSGILLTYDVTNEDSLNSLDNWITDIKKYIDINSIPLIVIANKIDLARKISQEEGQKSVKEISNKFYNGTREVPHIETSALTGENINIVLEKLSVDLLKLKTSMGK